MKNYVTPELVMLTYEDEVLTDVVSASATTAPTHEEIDGFQAGWLN